MYALKTITMIKKILFISSFLLLYGNIHAQSDSSTVSREIKAGIRIQKTQKLYWENGFAVDYTCSKLWDRRVHLGLSYTTSRLGSALNSNAIKQDNYLFNASYHFRKNKSLHPFIRLNLGYFYADYEDAVFQTLDNSTFMVALDAGIYYQFDIPITIGISAGYNLTSGNGVSGPGSLYPIYYQMSLFYTIFKQ